MSISDPPFWFIGGPAGAPSGQTHPLSILDFPGADPTGATDSTDAMVTASETGQVIYYPAGNYKCADDITIPGGGIIGDGAYQTFINTSSTSTNNVFNYTGALAGRFENFQIQTLNTKSGGYGISVGPATGEVSAMRFFQVVMNGLPYGINFNAASLWSVTACNFYQYTGTAIVVNNTNNADSGDSVIMGCQFFNIPANTSSNGIEQFASGGLKVIGNKFNNNGVGYILNLANGSTSDLLVTANSFENSHFSGIQLQRQGGSTASFENAVIVGNEFLVSSASGSSGGIYSNQGATWLYCMSINGNTFFIDDTGAASAILLDYVSDGVISGNSITGSGGTSLGIDLGSHNANMMLGINRVNGCGTPYSVPAGFPQFNPVASAGWGVPTGNAAVANYPGASATLVQTSNAVAQIIADLQAAGLYTS